MVTKENKNNKDIQQKKFSEYVISQAHGIFYNIRIEKPVSTGRRECVWSGVNGAVLVECLSMYPSGASFTDIV